MELLDTFITGHLFKFLNCPYDDVSLSVFRLTTSYLNVIVFKSLNTTTNPPSLPPKYLEHIQIFLNIIRNKLKYMDDFDFNSKDEEEAQFLEYRKELRGIFKIITKISPQVNILSIYLILYSCSINLIYHTPPSSLFIVGEPICPSIYNYRNSKSCLVDL